MRWRSTEMAKPAIAGAPWRWALAGALVGGLLCLLVFFPARWIAGTVASASGRHVLLQDARGSIWKGSAVLVLAGGAGSRDAQALPGRLGWQLHAGRSAAVPGTQGRGWGMGVSVEHACCQKQRLQLFWLPFQQRFQLSALDWQLPAQVLAGLGTPWNTLSLEGRIQLSSSFLQWSRSLDAASMRGSLELKALSLSSRLSTLRPLGSYRMILDAQGAQSGTGLGFELDTLQGALRLSGKGQQLAGHWRFQGQAQAEPGQDAALANILNLIGNRGGDIAWSIVRPQLP
ncbi:type II secretion system protein N [Comamonas aquatilis]